MGSFGDALSEVFYRLYIFIPPLGGTHLLFLKVGVGQGEEITLGIEARVCSQNCGAYLLCREVCGSGEELFTYVKAIIVFGGNVSGNILGLGIECGSNHSLVAHLVQEEVLLDGEFGPGAADIEDTLVVGGHTLDGVILEHHLAQCDIGAGGTVVQAEERAEAVPNGVVAEGDLAYSRILAHVKTVAAAAGYIVDIAALDQEL